jgi:hypothetical protein
MAWLKKANRWSGSRTRPSWRARARNTNRTRLRNVLQWWGVALPADWDTWDEETQLKWARRVLAELATDSDSDKVRTMAAGNLARSLEPKARAQAQPSHTQPSAGMKQDRAYLEAVRAELDAKLEKLDKDSS